MGRVCLLWVCGELHMYSTASVQLCSVSGYDEHATQKNSREPTADRDRRTAAGRGGRGGAAFIFT